MFAKGMKLDLEEIQMNLKVPVTKDLVEIRSKLEHYIWSIAINKMNFPRTRTMIYIYPCI